jgi:hypothetical protein
MLYCALYFHLQLCQRASSAAYALSRLWKQSAHVKLLQQPPARKISNKLASLLIQSKQHVIDLEEALREATPICSDLVEGCHPQYGHDLVAAVMEAKPVSTIARLLVWLQQQPELLRLHAWEDNGDDEDDAAAGDEAAACTSSSSSDPGIYGSLWLNSAIGKGTKC